MARSNRLSMVRGGEAYATRLAEVQAKRKMRKRRTRKRDKAMARAGYGTGWGGFGAAAHAARGTGWGGFAQAAEFGMRQGRRKSRKRSGGSRRGRGRPVQNQSRAQVAAFVKSQKALLRWAKAHGNRGLAVKCAKTLGTIHRKTGKR